MDVLAGGLSASHLPLWAQMARQTSGTLILQEGFGGMLSRNVAAALQRKLGTAAQLDVMCSNGLAVDRIIGPTATEVKRGRRRGELDSRDGRVRSAAARDAANLEAGQAFAVLLKSTKDIQGRHVLVQAVARWTTPTNLRVMRVRPLLRHACQLHTALRALRPLRRAHAGVHAPRGGHR